MCIRDSAQTGQTDKAKALFNEIKAGQNGNLSEIKLAEIEVAIYNHSHEYGKMEEFTSTDKDELIAFAKRVKFPVVAKVVGPVHKSCLLYTSRCV